jgi:hypothetical protein
MLRKIEYRGDFPTTEEHIQFSVIEIQTKEVVNELEEPEEYNVAYLDVAETYQAIVDYETIISYDEEGNEVEVQNPIYETVEVDMDSFSLPATWNEIQNVLHFDFKIKDRLYTFGNTPGAIKVGLQDSIICRTVYEPVMINYGDRGNITQKQSYIKRLVTPTEPPLLVINGVFTVQNNYDEFVEQYTKEQMTLEDIELYRDGVFIKNYR